MNQAPKEARITPLNEQHADYCPGTLIRKIVTYRKQLAIEEKYISLIRPDKKKKRKHYFKTSNVPIKDFGRFMSSLADQFTGTLSTIKDSKLKKLSLPVMIPSGIGLPEMPEASATTLVVVTSGQWNGVLFCREAGEEPVALTNFQSAKNGDILGLASLENGETLSLLNMESILKREGFLTMV